MNPKTTVLIAVGVGGITMSDLLQNMSVLGISFTRTYEAVIDLIQEQRLAFKGTVLHRT